ncbi:hypothetical protein NIES4101_49410 [Calothrix sp. NIES-4101]|nr:hypothetical protein NIES4101_49410 [Calothrix sp. NIES-4101]
MWKNRINCYEIFLFMRNKHFSYALIALITFNLRKNRPYEVAELGQGRI